MTNERKIQIANSFSNLNVESNLDLTISNGELKTLRIGIYAKNMAEKWNVFVLEENLYFARSWTDHCIYKVNFTEGKENCKLNKISITRDSKQYRSQSIENNIIVFKKILQMCIGREDIYVDERLKLGLIKETIEKYDPNNLYKKSIGKQSVELINRIYNGLKNSNSDKIEIIGLKEFQINSSKFDKEYKLLSLHLSKRNSPKEATTFYFNEDASEYVGQITIKNKNAS